MKLVSIAVKGNTVKVCLFDNGVYVKGSQFRVVHDGNLYRRSLAAVEKALVYTRGYLEENRDDSVVTFELSNEAVVNWLRGTSEYPSRYTMEVYKVRCILEQIPIRYLFCWQKVPRAVFTELDEVKMESAGSLLEEE